MDRPINVYALKSDYHKAEVKKASRTGRLALFLLVFLIVTAAVMAFLRSPIFVLTDITVQGTNELNSQELIRVAQIYPGSNIWKIDRRKAENLLQQLPRVDSVQVQLDLPHGLQILINEKQTLGLVPYQDKYVEIAADGYPVGLCEGRDNLPIVTGLHSLDPANLQIPDQVEREALGKVLRAVEAKGQGIIAQVDFSGDEIVVFTREGLAAFLGPPVEMNVKIEKLVVMAPYVEANFGIDKGFIDLGAPGRPTFRYFSGEILPEKVME